jgi:hypothetical protein
MIKLLFSAITWLLASGGFIAGPSWLTSDNPVDPREKVAIDRHCRDGAWPDRARACVPETVVSATTNRLQAPEVLLQFDPARQSALASRIRIYDASQAAPQVVATAEPVESAPAEYALSGLTRTISIAPAASADPAAERSSLPRVAQASQSASQSQDEIEADERIPDAAAPASHRGKSNDRLRRAAPRSMFAKEQAPRRRLASYTARPQMMRVYGVAF